MGSRRKRDLVARLPIGVHKVLRSVDIAFREHRNDYISVIFACRNGPISKLSFLCSSKQRSYRKTTGSKHNVLRVTPKCRARGCRLGVRCRCGGLTHNSSRLQTMLSIIAGTDFPRSTVRIGTHMSRGTTPTATGIAATRRDATAVTATGPSARTARITPSPSRAISSGTPCHVTVRGILSTVGSHGCLGTGAYFALSNLSICGQLVSCNAKHIIKRPGVICCHDVGKRIITHNLRVSFSFTDNGHGGAFIRSIIFAFGPSGGVYGITFKLNGITRGSVLGHCTPN